MKKKQIDIEAGLKLAQKPRSIGTTLVEVAEHYKYGYFEGPDTRNLSKYETAIRRDPIIRRAIMYITNCMVASLGDYVHEDPRAVAFYKEQMQRLEGNIHQYLAELIYSSLWSGKGISEKVLVADKGRIWLKKMINYHSRSISLIPNDRGELVDNDQILYHPTFLRSGAYQEVPWSFVANNKNLTKGRRRAITDNYLKLPLNKLVITSYNSRYGNVEGESILEAVWLRYKMMLETWQNLMITTERWGSPQLLIVVPSAVTKETKIDESGNTVPKTLAEVTAKGLESISTSSAIVLEEPFGLSSNEKIRAQVLSSFNNFGENFLSIIRALYADILVGIGVPPLLFLEHSESLGSGSISQVHADTYRQLLNSLYREFIEPFTEQVIGQLLRLNFGITDPGYYTFTPVDITSTINMMSMFDTANNNGIIDTSILEDLQYVRSVLGIPQISKDSQKTRLKNNNRLMENVIRNPNKAMVDVAAERNEVTLETSANMVSAQKSMNKESLKSREKLAAEANENKIKLERIKLAIAKSNLTNSPRNKGKNVVE